MKWCFEGSALKDPFSHSFLKFQWLMQIKVRFTLVFSEKEYHISFPSNFTLYKWCVTKVAHCIFISMNRGTF